MRLKGLSKYDVTDIDGTLAVRSLGKGGMLKPSRYGAYAVVTDREERKSVSIGQLRFMMRHPDLDADDIQPALQKVRFSNDGTVKGLYEDKRQRRQRTVFRDIDEVLATVLVMKAAAAGDTAYLDRYAEENWDEAVAVAAKGYGFQRDMRGLYAEAHDHFIHKATEANFRMIQPLMRMLVNAAKKAYGDVYKTPSKERRLRDWETDRSTAHATYQPECEP